MVETIKPKSVIRFGLKRLYPGKHDDAAWVQSLNLDLLSYNLAAVLDIDALLERADATTLQVIHFVGNRDDTGRDVSDVYRRVEHYRQSVNS